MPITWPSKLNVGPPELPRFIGASICRKSSNGPEWMSRPRAEMIPVVTVPPSPNGFPTAITQSPTCDALLSPKLTCGSALSALILKSYLNLAGVSDHMAVRHHVAGRINDKTGSEGDSLCLGAWRLRKRVTL